MVFFSCAVCDIEVGMSEMKKLDEKLLQCIRISGMPALYERLTKDKDDETASSCDRGYANAAYTELTVDGLLKDAVYVCKTCVRQLPKPKQKRKPAATVAATAVIANDHDSDDDAHAEVDDAAVDNEIAAEAVVGNDVPAAGAVVDNDVDAIKRGYVIGRNNGVPTYALVNGYFRGQCPPELLALTDVDLSLVTPINTILRTCMLPKGTHYGSNLTTFAVLNKLSEVVDVLPRNPEQSGYAILRRPEDKCPRPLQYSPWRLTKALDWLYANNTAIQPIIRNAVQALEPMQVDLEVELPTIETNDADYEGIEDVTDDNTRDPEDLFFQVDDKEMDVETQVEKILSPSQAPSLVRSRGVYTPDHETPNFLQLAFIRCFPFGRGKFFRLTKVFT